MQSSHKSERDERIFRLQQLIKTGIDPYPARLKKETTPVKVLLEQFEKLSTDKKTLGIAGRMISKRVHGTLLFADVQDGSGKIQLYIKKDFLEPALFDLIESAIDIGDIIFAEGILEMTKRGEKSLLVSDFELLSKSLRPLPEKWHGLQDIETRFRKRELDLLANDEIKNIFAKRHVFLKALRSFLDANNFLEVETPILQPIPGGATARPFITHHNSLNQDMYLRVAPELYLKRLIVGGFDRVYEVARCFRNEGIDVQHNPEFTQIELYAAYFDFKKMMTFAEKMIADAITQTMGTPIVNFQGEKIDFTPPYPRKSFDELFSEYLNFSLAENPGREALASLAKDNDLSIDASWGTGKMIDELYKKTIRPNLSKPIFITHHPIDLSPLAKKDATNPLRVERFQLVACSMELMNAFSELNNPIEQNERFNEQERLRAKGDDEAQYKDDAFIESLEYGLPPTAGLGFGIDRCMTILADTKNIKEVILFPTLRTKE